MLNKMLNKMSDWKDKEFLKSYYRLLQRKRKGIKNHPYILDDGTKYIEKYPSIKKHYIQSPKFHCELCDKEYFEKNKERHLTSKCHLVSIGKKSLIN